MHLTTFISLFSDQSMSEDSNTRNDDSDDTNQSETTVYADVLSKLHNLQEKSAEKEEQRNVLNDGAKYMTELIILMEKHKDQTMDQTTAVSINEAIQSFLNTAVQIEMKELWENDSASAKEIFYSYMKIFNLSAMKNYLQLLHMQMFVKVLYEKCIIIILAIVASIITHCKFTVVDLQEPRDNQEILRLMLNYIKGELDPQSSLPYSVTTRMIFSFLWNYADKTVVVPNLIKVGYPEAVLKWLSLFHG